MVKSDIKRKKRKSRKRNSSEATQSPLPSTTKTRKRTKLDPSRQGNLVESLDVSASFHKGSQESRVFSTTLSADQGSDRTGLKSSKALLDVTLSTQDTLHLSHAALHSPLSLNCEADRDAQLLADQDDFSDLSVDDHSDEWFADESLQEAGPEWLSNKVYHPDTMHDPEYDQLVALAESGTPLSQVSGNRVKSDRPKTIEMDPPATDHPASSAESFPMDFDLSENFQAATPFSVSSSTISRQATPSGKLVPPSHALEMKPPPKPIAAHEIGFNPDGSPLPFVRPPFPKGLRVSSPVQGLQTRPVLRTVFRVGEAINAASTASRKSLNATVELYARVVRSSRTDFKQHFLFADLFTDKPPHLQGTYGVWKGVELWEQDADVFLGHDNRGKMCRVVGTVKIKESGRPHMSVLSIWECSYEDIGTAKGIVCS